MPTLNIEGRSVNVDDSFLKLAPEQQNATVDEIAKSFSQGGGVQTVPGQNGQPTRVIMNMGQQKPSVLEDVAKSAGVGLARGGIGLAGSVGDLSTLLAQGSEAAGNYIGGKLGFEPHHMPQSSVIDNITSHAIQKKIEEYTGEFYKPQTIYGEYAQTAGEFAPAALGGEASLLARGARTLIPAATSETAGQLTKGSKLEPVARFLGAIAGGGATALASRPGTAARSIADQLPAGVTEPMVIKADALMQEAASRGIQLAWPEALSQVAGRRVLTNMMRHLEASPQTEAQMSSFFGQRPQQVEGAVRGELGNIASPNYAPSSIGHEVGAAAQRTVKDVKGLINQASDPYYKAAEGVLLTPAEMAHVKKIPGYQQARDAVRKDPQLNSYVEHLPDNSVGFLNEVKKQFDQMGTNAGSKFNPNANQQVAAVNSKAAEALKQIGEVKSPEYAVALKFQADAREKHLQPLLNGPLGKIAQKDTATKDAINALFPKNPLPNSENEIAVTMSALAKRNQRAARDLVRAHAESTFNEAAKDLQSGANQAGGAKFRAELIGNSQQAKNLEAAVTALPHGNERWDGMKKMLDVLEATGTRQNIGSRTAYNTEINKELGAGGLVRDATKIASNPVKLAQPLIDKYEQWKLGKNLGQLASVITDPNAVNLFRAIARAPSNSDQARMLALKLITYGNASQRTPVQKPNQ